MGILRFNRKIKNMKLFAAVLDMDNAKDARYVAKINGWMEKISEANCDREGADVQVFSADDYCKLNSQINSALSSAARRWACDGRGKVYRQAVRRLKKVKNQYNRNHCS